MAVTEVALCRLKGSANFNDPAFKSRLREAKAAMEAFTGFQFSYYEQLEDPALFYIIGAWSSLQQHLTEWIPSAENQKLLTLLKDDIDVEWLLHVDVDDATLPLAAPVMVIARYAIDKNNKEGFEQRFAGVRHILEACTAPQPVACGWVVDVKPLAKEEFVLFSGWGGMSEHAAFAQSDGFAEYRTITEFLEGNETMHAKRVDLG